MNFKLLFSTVLALCAVTPVYAENVSITDADTTYEEVFMPEMFASSVTIDDDDEYPLEPNFQKVDFLRIDPPASLDERVSRLVHGISVDLPPEYDHYGYEIRRYMASIGHPKIHEEGQDEYLISQIKNVRKASVIADYWKKSVDKEIEEIEKALETEVVSFATKTAFKQNTVAVRTFMVSLKSWINSNEKFLMYVFNNPAVYELYYPEVIFLKPNLRVEYFNLLNKKSQKLKDIREYRPFEMMVY